MAGMLPRSDSGIAIGPILFIIAIFAVLATAISAGSSSFAINSTSESERTLASSIISIGQQYVAAIQKLTAMGCSVDQISFDAPGLPSSIANPRSPADHHCDLYHPQGAGLVMRKLPDEALNDPLDDYASGYYLPGQIAWKGYPYAIGTASALGTSQSDVILLIHGLKSGVCSAISRLIGRSVISSFVYTPEKNGPYPMRNCSATWCDTYSWGNTTMGCNKYATMPEDSGGNMWYFYAILDIR